MRAIDLNADMGEYATASELAIETALMAFITSCSIACGGHAGDDRTMKTTIRAATKYQVRIGAHPSYPDREGFGRNPFHGALSDLQRTLENQISGLQRILDIEKVPLNHVKPHGALYNAAARDSALAKLVISAIAGTCGRDVFVVGPPLSELENAANDASVQFAPEGFVDRLYCADGTLTPRDKPGAIITASEDRALQACAIASGRTFPARDGQLSLSVRTLCIHSDSPGAVETAIAVRNALKTAGINVEAFS